MFAAFAVRSRMIERFGDRAEHAWSFPTRERIASAREEELVELGFSRRKAEYVVSLARSELDFEELRELPDEEVKARLVAIRGLGEWTADWFLARYLGRPRAWPAGDLALQKAVRVSSTATRTPRFRRPLRALPEPERPLPADRRSNGRLVSDCVFCELIAGEASQASSTRTRRSSRFMDLHPVNPGHVLLVPRRHVAAMEDLDEESGAHAFRIAMRMQRALRGSGVRCEGINLFVADGEAAFQDVFHFHLHVIPRFAGDPFKISADWKEAPRSELDRVATEIRMSYERLWT